LVIEAVLARGIVLRSLIDGEWVEALANH